MKAICERWLIALGIRNYQEFIKVSKDIAALETEMLEMKSVLEEWKTVPEGLEIEQSFDPNASTGVRSIAAGSAKAKLPSQVATVVIRLPICKPYTRLSLKRSGKPWRARSASCLLCRTDIS